MSKFYAVKAGRNPGIYTTWKECEKNVKGYSGAVYKSFPTRQEAENYLGNTNETLIAEKPSQISLIEVFTDGSHRKHEKNGHMGIGIFCSYLGNEYLYAETITTERILRDYTDSSVSNPFLEFLAYETFLKLLYTSAKDVNKYTFVVKMDYEGVQKWINGDWQAREPYIVKIRDSCFWYLRQINSKILIEHVPAHSGVYGNERADQLAKSEQDVNTFPKLFDVL